MNAVELHHIRVHQTLGSVLYERSEYKLNTFVPVKLQIVQNNLISAALKLELKQYILISWDRNTTNM